MPEKYVVSACLTGQNCKYNGKSNPCEPVLALWRANLAIPICPETLAGLERPREPSEQREGKIFSKSGQNLTEEFTKGADLALKKAQASGAKKAILKSRSPSCGAGVIYSGNFDGTLKPGDGLWTQKLKQAGFEIFTEENLPPEIAKLIHDTG